MHLQVALSSLPFLVLIQQITSQMSNTSETNWTCTCSSDHQETRGSIIASNYSGSCDCGPGMLPALFN
ncbi:hypothetical protein RND81_09G058700 [Saponaria officinalis]|uniref:Uncharacterized protein n=1 Tax=Saponaria officinalis TaxID=3572 RepID=A0AAW1IJA1_SAPOF